MPPPKFGSTKRGTVSGSSAHNLVKFTIRAAPMPRKLWDFLQDNLAILLRLRQERQSREENIVPQTSNPEDHEEQEEDEIDLQGEIIKRPTVKPDEFWQVFQEKCSEIGGEWAGVVDQIMAFGPQRAGTCLLIDSRTDGQPPNS